MAESKEKSNNLPFATVTRIENFNAAHRLHNPKFSAERNKEIFGKCNNPNGHGHNYKVEITIQGPVDEETGMVINISDLKVKIQRLLSTLDHKHLDLDVEHFKHVVSTAENIAIYIWDELAKILPEGSLYKVKLHETEKNVAIYKGKRT